jgi:starch-binding outer membrane protein, SusD/RagB family
MTRTFSIVAAAGLAIALAACNYLLDVNAPDRVPAETLDNPANAALMVNSAIGDFECAFGSYTLVEAIISDEFADAQLGAAGWPYDRRDANTQPAGIYGTNPCDNNQNPGLYTPVSTARWTADNGLRKLQGWTDQQVPNRHALMAQAALYAGFSYSLMGMAMCEAAFDLEAPIGQAAMFGRAEDRFTTAIAEAGAAGGMQDVNNAALVGRARVRLFQGNLTGAAADAQLVPAGFLLQASAGADANRRYNRVYAATAQFGLYTVDPQSRALRVGPTVFAGDTTGFVVDPRSKVDSMATRAADAVQKIYAPDKYSTDAAPLPIARYEEARLILAEAQGGAAAVGIINTLRDADSLPHYTGATDSASVAHLIADERRRVLFAEGFRNYDIQRFAVPLIPAPGTDFQYPGPLKGGSYGNTTCLPLPDIERFNNPNASVTR